MGLTRRMFSQGAAGAAAAVMLGAPARAEARLSIVATTGMLADAARQVGGDRAQVRALMGPGVDPHAYRQTRSDVVALAKADLALWHGLYLEAQLEPLLRDLARTRPVVAAAEALPPEELLANADYPDRNDPHVWMDPTLWAQVVAAVRDAMIAAAPDARRAFEDNAARHVAEIAALGDYASTALASVPADSRVLVTAHDAFHYLARAYGFEVVGVQGVSTESEAGLSRIAAIVDLLVSRDVKAVFVESSVSDRNMRALIEGAAAAGHAVAIGGELFSDAMGAEGSYEGSYIGMIDHNVTTIARALGGDAPARGMRGRLSASEPVR